MNVEKQHYLETADIETASDDYASRFSGEVGRFFLERQLAITLAILERYDAPTLLDVGGGHGQLAIPLARRDFQVTVTGSADSCAERLRKELPPHTGTRNHCRGCLPRRPGSDIMRGSSRRVCRMERFF